MTIEEFREAFAPFADSEKYPDTRVSSWMAFAEQMTDSRRWKCSGLRDRAIGFLTAHYLQIAEQRDELTGEAAIPTAAAGAKTSESQSADGVSYSDGYDATAYTGAGQLASTWYGQMFLDLKNIVGLGGFQV